MRRMQSESNFYWAVRRKGANLSGPSIEILWELPLAYQALAGPRPIDISLCTVLS